jgi:hypothetical protein
MTFRQKFSTFSLDFVHKVLNPKDSPEAISKPVLRAMLGFGSVFVTANQLLTWAQKVSLEMAVAKQVEGMEEKVAKQVEGLKTEVKGLTDEQGKIGAKIVSLDANMTTRLERLALRMDVQEFRHEQEAAMLKQMMAAKSQGS